MHARAARSEWEKDDFSKLLREVCAGARPFASIEEHSHFLSRGRQICRRVVRGRSDGAYDAEDLFLDACVRMLAHEEMFIREGSLVRVEESALDDEWDDESEDVPPNAPPDVSDDAVFFKRFLVLTAGMFRRRLRKQHVRAWDAPWGYDPWYRPPRVAFVPISECREVEAPGVDLEGGASQRVPRVRRSWPALRAQACRNMWLENYSLREIQTALHGDGSLCSHTVIRRWIADSLKDFVAPRGH